MSIFSIQFVAFAVICSGIFFVVPKKMQWIVILCANVFFYAFVGIRYLLLIIVTSLVTFFTALRLEDLSTVSEQSIENIEDFDVKTNVRNLVSTTKKYLCAIVVLSVGGIWAVLKYSNFFINNVNRAMEVVNYGKTFSMMSWILPLGISFYTFHNIGYVVDVYRGKYKAERNFFKYFTFVSYFPHIIQGPFSRYDLLGKSILKEHDFSYVRLCDGLSRILWGTFKKLIIADQLGICVNLVFNNYQIYSSISIILAIITYSVEIYADFSGYMDIVCGLSSIWGIELSENFKRPYLARTVDEFWRRWHITLGKWFKDYVFYPVSMSSVGQKLGKNARKKWGARMGKLVPGYFALIFVWTATGLWHGANWTYLVWGYLNLFVIISTMQLGDFYNKIKSKLSINSDGFLWQSFCIIRTFIIVCFFRFFSFQPSLHTALSILKHVILDFEFKECLSSIALLDGIESMRKIVVLTGVLALLFTDLLQELKFWELIKTKCPFVVKNLVYAILIILLVLMVGGSTDLTGGFMYANF